MASKTTESQPLLGQRDRPSTSRTAALKGQRTVTFNPLTQIQSQPGTSNAGAPLRPAHSPSSTLTSGASLPTKEPMLSAFNSKLRRRNSHGAPLPTSQPLQAGIPRVGAQRTSRTAEKLKILPNPEYDVEGPDEESGRDVYSQFTRIKDPNARRDAARLGRADRDRLPRVTAYCTAQGYRLDGIMRFAKSRNKTRGANPKLFDECLYTPYDYNKINKRKATDDMLTQTLQRGERSNSRSPVEERFSRAMGTRSPRTTPNDRRYSDSAVEVEEHQKDQREHLLDLQDELIPPAAIEENEIENENAIDDPEQQLTTNRSGSQDDIGLDHHRTVSSEMEESSQVYATGSDFSTDVESPEVFIFDYGTVVIWGMTLAQEQRFLNDIAKFATSPLPAESIETEEFNFYYTHSYQARIYNDFISLRDPRNHMIKIAISHALSQSVKTSLFEDLVSETIETTSPLPAVIAQTGSVNLTRRQLNMQIGELFILRINIHLQGSVLDNPELMWAEPHLEPVYAAVRSYLEIGQRVGLLTERLDVISDLLAVLREQGSRRHDEILEWIVIVLIAAEIIVAAINIVVDVWAGEV